MDGDYFAINRILEEAANLVGGSKEPAGNAEQTEGYKRKQIERLKEFATIHNLWIDCSGLSLTFLSKGGENEFCAVLMQSFVRARREATEKEIQHYMESLGFCMDYPDEFHNEQYEIFDAVPNNVLHGIDGQLYFIDTQIRLR